MHINIEIPDLLAERGIEAFVETTRICADVQTNKNQTAAETQQFSLRSNSLQKLFESLKNAVITYLTNNNSSNTSIMPMLLGMMMGNNGFSAQQQTPLAKNNENVVKNEESKPTQPKTPETPEMPVG